MPLLIGCVIVVQGGVADLSAAIPNIGGWLTRSLCVRHVNYLKKKKNNCLAMLVCPPRKEVLSRVSARQLLSGSSHPGIGPFPPLEARKQR